MEGRKKRTSPSTRSERVPETDEARMMALLHNRPWIRTVLSPLFFDQEKNHVITHSIRVAELAVAIGERAGLEDEDLDLLRLSGLLHDNGKSETPDYILNADGPVSDADFAAFIAPHPKWGFDALIAQGKHASSLEEQQEMEQLALIIVAHHKFKERNPYPKDYVSISDMTIQDERRLVNVDDFKMRKLQQILAIADYIESRTDGAHLRHYHYNNRLTFKEALVEAKKDLVIDSSLFEYKNEPNYSQKLQSKIMSYLDGY